MTFYGYEVIQTEIDRGRGHWHRCGKPADSLNRRFLEYVRWLSLVRFFLTNLSGVWILSGFSVRCLSVRILSVSILSAVRILSGISKKTLSGVCLSGFCLSRFCPLSVFCPEFSKKRCPLSVCPAGQGQDRAVRTFGVLVHRRLVLVTTKSNIIQKW